MTRFEIGPAAATAASPHCAPRRFIGLYGVGLAQPMKKPPGRSTVIARSRPPSGSKCARGSSVRRPSSRAVPSPRRKAVSACANSCSGNAIKSMIAITAILTTSSSALIGATRESRPRRRRGGCWSSRGSQAAEEVLLLGLVLLWADRAPVAQVGEVAERARDLVGGHRARRRRRRGRDGCRLGRRRGGPQRRRGDLERLLLELVLLVEHGPLEGLR